MSHLTPASVFWDFENCQCPKDVPVSKFLAAIRKLLFDNGLYAQEIHAIGHFSQLSHQNLVSLTEMGVNMTDVPSKKQVLIRSDYKNSADLTIMTAMAKLMYFHKPPYGMVLISGDRDFTSAVNFMNQVGFYVILVHQESQNVDKELISAANQTILWSSLFESDPEIRITRLSTFKNWMRLSEMQARVDHVTAKSLSEEDLHETLPPIREFQRNLCRTHGYQCFEAFIPTMRNILSLSKGDGWTRWVNLDELDTELISLCGFKSRRSWIALALGISMIDFDKKTSKLRINPEKGMDSLERLCRFSGPNKEPLLQAKEINILLGYLSKAFSDDGVLLKKALKFGRISIQTRLICFEKSTMIKEIDKSQKDRLISKGMKNSEEYLQDVESKGLIGKCECNQYPNAHYSFIKRDNYQLVKSASKIKSQRKLSLLPALKDFVDRFGRNQGSVFDIPVSYVKECGYSDQFHWAVIAEYYDLVLFDHNTGKAVVSEDVISWLGYQQIQDLKLCRFINSVLFLSESNCEAKIVTSNIHSLRIGSLKMSEVDFGKKQKEWGMSGESFSGRDVVRVNDNQIAFVFPWLLNQDRAENARAIDQMNFLRQHPEFMPLLEFMDVNSSEILDNQKFQNSNPDLLKKYQYKSWDEFYSNACLVIDGLQMEKLDENDKDTEYEDTELKIQIEKAVKKKNSRNTTVENNSGNNGKGDSDSLQLFIEIAVLFVENGFSKSLSQSIILKALPYIYKEKGFLNWKSYFEKGKSLCVLGGDIDFVSMKRRKCEEILEVSGLDPVMMEYLKIKIRKRLEIATAEVAKGAARRKKDSEHQKALMSHGLNVSTEDISDIYANAVDSDYAAFEIIANFMNENGTNDWINAIRILPANKKLHEKYGFKKFKEYLLYGESLGFISVESRKNEIWIKMSKTMQKKILANIRNQTAQSQDTRNSMVISVETQAGKSIAMTLDLKEKDKKTESEFSVDSNSLAKKARDSDYAAFEIIANFMNENGTNDWINAMRILPANKKLHEKYGFKKFKEYLLYGESLGFISVESRQNELWIKMSKTMQKEILANIRNQNPQSRNTGNSMVISLDNQAGKSIATTLGCEKHVLVTKNNAEVDLQNERVSKRQKIHEPVLLKAENKNAAKDIYIEKSQARSEIGSRNIEVGMISDEDEDYICFRLFSWFRRKREIIR